MVNSTRQFTTHRSGGKRSSPSHQGGGNEAIRNGHRAWDARKPLELSFRDPQILTDLGRAETAIHTLQRSRRRRRHPPSVGRVSTAVRNPLPSWLSRLTQEESENCPSNLLPGSRDSRAYPFMTQSGRMAPSRSVGFLPREYIPPSSAEVEQATSGQSGAANLASPSRSRRFGHRRSRDAPARSCPGTMALNSMWIFLSHVPDASITAYTSCPSATPKSHGTADKHRCRFRRASTTASNCPSVAPQPQRGSAPTGSAQSDLGPLRGRHTACTTRKRCPVSSTRARWSVRVEPFLSGLFGRLIYDFSRAGVQDVVTRPVGVFLGGSPGRDLIPAHLLVPASCPQEQEQTDGRKHAQEVDLRCFHIPVLPFSSCVNAAESAACSFEPRGASQQSG